MIRAHIFSDCPSLLLKAAANSIQHIDCIVSHAKKARKIPAQWLRIGSLENSLILIVQSRLTVYLCCHENSVLNYFVGSET